MARFNALRNALEEDRFLGGGPMGISEEDAPVIDYGDTTMARAAGLRARPPVAADWREKEAERVARERLDAERMVPSPEMLSRVAERSRDLGLKLTSPIPVASASPTKDAIAPVTSALPSTGPQSPAGKPESMGASGLPAPETGAGGDASERDLYIARLAAQSAAGFGGMGAGKSIDMGIADTLGERLKQVQALRAKREERAEVLAQERTQNDQLLDAYKGMFPEQADELESLRGATGKPMFRDLLAAWQKKTEFEKAKLPTAEARVAQMGAGTSFTQARTAEVGLEGESRRQKREQDIALGWARLNAQATQAAQKAAQDLANTGASRAEQKDIDNQLENIQKIVKGGSYTPLIASLEQADKAIADLGAPPSTAAQMKHALPGGDRFLSPQEKAYYTSVDKLRQMDQLAVSGKVVSEPERAEFLRQYGANWYASPKAAAAYIDMLRAKTANQLNSDLASIRASPSGQKALAAYERQSGAVTPMHPVFKGAGQRPSPSAVPTESQIAKLRANPDRAADFDAKFGAGAAAKILGGP